MIKLNRKMPKNCIECPFSDKDTGTCLVSDDRFLVFVTVYDDIKDRHPWCPLIEQEAILLENQHKRNNDSLNPNLPLVSRCPKCKKKIEGKRTRFCEYCGQAVKWE